MEIFILVLLYYFSQNPDFAESVKPLMAKLKDSEQMLRFLNDLSKFTETFSGFQPKPETPPKPPCNDDKPPHAEEKENKNPQSSTKGIADEFIQQILDGYLSKQ